jgi:putative ABC transport system permease protein
MSYALATLWHDRNRYLAAVLAVTFSAVLIVMQSGLLLGLFAVTSIPIDHTSADIWVGNADVSSVDLGRPIPRAWLGRLARQPEVESAEIYLQGFSHWAMPGGGSELVCVVAGRLQGPALGALRELTPELRERLTEPGAVVVDEAELGRLGIRKVGDTAEILGRRVRVVGLVHGLKSIAGPYVFCSVRTARPLLRLTPGQTTYLLARCRRPEDVPVVVERLRKYPSMAAFTSGEFSLRSRLHWLVKTKAGIAMGCAAVLGLLVGAVVTSQTLYAATAASLREFAVLRALGIPRWRMKAAVLAQSFWVGLAGLALALPAVWVLSAVAEMLGAKVIVPAELFGVAAAVTMLMVFVSGLAALRSLRRVEPAALLR